MDVIKKLNILRAERKLSVYRLAELSGINQSTLANTFSRGTIPSIQNLELLCEAMGLTLAQFFMENECSFYLSEKEISLINNFRRLQNEVQSSFGELINNVSKTFNT